ncbi:hypothetical protein Pmani_024490 [Petrolisthes manimaculis]|uniref:Uncharacterized protein n=1 Tax=Petrolisthes manimaculis TaxID=1843537 RepID=A0AAE1P932_9EUCA|nr:hypothetical protein Pmani_024490 [Petrolisthes manimaculis]
MASPDQHRITTVSDTRTQMTSSNSNTSTDHGFTTLLVPVTLRNRHALESTAAAGVVRSGRTTHSHALPHQPPESH